MTITIDANSPSRYQGFLVLGGESINPGNRDLSTGYRRGKAFDHLACRWQAPFSECSDVMLELYLLLMAEVALSGVSVFARRCEALVPAPQCRFHNTIVFRDFSI